MNYDLEAINTLFAQIAECMHRNPARAMRLLGQAKAKVREALERAANNQAVRLAAPQASADSAWLTELMDLVDHYAIGASLNKHADLPRHVQRIRKHAALALKSAPAAEAECCRCTPCIVPGQGPCDKPYQKLAAEDSEDPHGFGAAARQQIADGTAAADAAVWGDDAEDCANGAAGDGDLHFIAGTIVLYLKGPVDPAGVIAASRSIKAWIDRQQRGGDVDERAAFEVWASETAGLNVEIEIDHAEYEHDSTRDAWDGWQARAALAAQPAVSAEPVAWHVDDKGLGKVYVVFNPDDAAALQADASATVRPLVFADAALAAHKPDGGDAKDAARYRWLKTQMRAMSIEMGGKHTWVLSRSLPRAPTVDAACDAGIDAAIAQQRQEEA